MKTIIKFENDARKATLNNDNINWALYRAYQKAGDIGNEIITFYNINANENFKTMGENLEKYGINEITISEDAENLEELIKKFEEIGYKADGKKYVLNEIGTRYIDGILLQRRG